MLAKHWIPDDWQWTSEENALAIPPVYARLFFTLLMMLFTLLTNVYSNQFYVTSLFLFIRPDGLIPFFERAITDYSKSSELTSLQTNPAQILFSFCPQPLIVLFWR